MPDEAIETLVSHGAELPTATTDFEVAHFGGAVERVPADETAFPHRSAPFVLNINTRWEGPAGDDEHVAWTRELFEAMQPFSTGHTYVNVLGDEGDDRVRAAYESGTYERLAALKREHDPDNLFRHNQNVTPEGDG